MVFNVEFQICGLIMVLMVMFFYFTNKTLQISSEKIYSYLLITVAACVTLDITSVVLINLKNNLSEFLVNFICKAYTVSICMTAFFIRIYVFTNITHKKLDRKQKFFCLLPLLIDVICCFFLPIYYHVAKKQIYTFGPIVYVTYLTVAIYLFLSIYNMIRYRKAMDNYHFIAICFLLISWIVTAMIQFIKNEWLLVGFSMSASMVFMYLCLENPSQNIDNDTGLFNQAAYHLYMKNLFFKNKDFIIVVIAIEEMNFISETFGIENADMLFRDIAKYLGINFKGKAFRELEDRFSLLFDENIEEASKSIIKIRKRFEQPWKIAELEYKVSVNMIEMQSSVCELTMEKVAELSRYFISETKKSGKGTYLKISKKHVEEKERKHYVEKMLRRAINEKDIHVFYQPIYSTKENRYVSAEALTRITDEQGEYIPPDVFIRVAEQNGMILELGMLIFEAVCRFINAYPLQESGIQYIEINLSVVQCMQEKLADELIGVMQKYRISPDFINLEITETAAINSDMILKRNMNILIAKGVSFSLDDYGTGYSNLTYVIELPLKLIKIDKSFVQAYCNTEKVKIAMEFTISMIKKLGLKIVAEGIETEEQLAKMKELEVDYIQGYYFSRPLRQDDFLLELKNKNIN